ncbi:MAG: putative small lipoprotein YifL [Hydrogenophaga sp.]|jgi:predicted small lipoprotein YifL
MVLVFEVGHYNSVMEKQRVNEILGAGPGGRRCTALAALMVAGLLLAGCGQKGPLTLPSAAPAKVQTALPAAASAPAADNTVPERTDAAPR